MSERESLAGELRRYLLGSEGTDWALSDAELESYAERAKQQIAGRRWSWKVVAAEHLKKGRADQ